MKMEDTQKTRYLKRSMFALFLAAVVAFMFWIDGKSYHLPIFSGTTGYQEENWYFGEKGGTLTPTKLSDTHRFEPGKTYVLTTEISFNGRRENAPAAFFTIGNYETRIYLDDALMFHYTKENRGMPWVQSVGGTACSVVLGNNCQGKELTLELSTPMEYPLERRLPDISIGDYGAQVQELFWTYFPSVIISAAITFVVIVMVALGNADESTRWAYIHFAVFAMLIVIYRAMQNLYFLYVWGNPAMSAFLEFFSLVACPIPLLISYRFALKPYCTRTFDILIGLSVLNLVGELVLHLTGVVDVIQMIRPNHVWLLICGVSVVSVACYLRRRNVPCGAFRRLIPIMAGAVLDFLTFFFHSMTTGFGSFFSTGNFIGLGLLCALILMVWEARQERKEAFKEFERSRKLEKLAYRDSLTGLENRAAFTREIAAIQAGVYSGEQLLVVAADVNGLKKTNDSLGHAAGDLLLQRAALLLGDCFREFGNVYRTGGDEFFAILHQVDEEKWQQLQKRFYGLQQSRSESYDFPVSVAMGHAVLDSTIDKCVQLADKRMYENKSQFHHHRKYAFVESKE